MHPAGPPPSQNRSCHSPAVVQCPSPSPSLIQQQQHQQQHVIYGTITALQPCAANLHPHCVYTGIQRNVGFSGSSGLVSNQVPIRHAKVTKWQLKNKFPRPHHHHPNHHQPTYYQPLPQAHVQPPISCIPKPLVLYDQYQSNPAPPGGPPSTTSFLVASSTFAPYGPSDHYTAASGLALIPQTYLKHPETPQSFCLLPERSQQHQQALSSQGSYYNLSTNACSVQTINPKHTYHLTNVASSAYGNIASYGSNQITSSQGAAGNQIFQNPPVSINYSSVSRDKLSMVPGIDAESVTSARNFTVPLECKNQEATDVSAENNEWPVHGTSESKDLFEQGPDVAEGSRIPSSPIKTNSQLSSTITKDQDERYSDESAASFDFTIEAEKMVSALCNTASSNDLGREENHGTNEPSGSFGGAAGDTDANKANMWFTNFCTEYGVSLGQNVCTTSTQTHEDRHDPQNYPETMRKTIFWGCNEAENILNSSRYRGNSRAGWLTHISSATRTAVTKSSTCFPVFSGDRTFVRDLINGLLRISNGWLALDNYLNKQHYPSLSEKFDKELISRFQTWEVVTHDLLTELVKMFVGVEESISNSRSGPEPQIHQDNSTNTSFPGDVNLYTNNDLFDSSQRNQENVPKLNTCTRNNRDSTYTLQYPSPQKNNQNIQSFESQQQKETKPRSKWTITENFSSTVDSTKSVPDVSLTHNDSCYTSNNRYRVKNTSNTTKITSSSSRHSLNAEFFHLQNKVMESMGNANELDRQRWGLKEQQYDFIFGTSKSANSSGGIVTTSSEPLFKIRATGSTYENACARPCMSRMDQANSVNPQCTNMDGSVYLMAGTETALDSTYIAGGNAVDRIKTYAEPDYTGNVRIAELNEHNCGSGIVAVSATSISSIKTDPIYMGKATSEKTVAPKTKMTLLSQIEGNAPSASRGTKEMTADLSAWFASMRNSASSRAMSCSTEGRMNENVPAAKTSTQPQGTTRSAMDLNRQLHMDANRQLQTLKNMQVLQSQPWNASNLLNGKRTSNVHHHPDEYDSSEDLRVYMKPGSYNVPKKRHHRRNQRRSDNSGNSRTNDTSGKHTSRGNHGSNFISSGIKNNVLSTSIASIVIASSVEVSTTTTTTSSSIRVPFPATPIVPPPKNFALKNCPGILRRVASCSNQETRQDVAWKAACASAEILLEALSVKTAGGSPNTDFRNLNSLKSIRTDLNEENPDSKCHIQDSIQENFNDHSSIRNDNSKDPVDENFCCASSYEASDDDSNSICKVSPSRFGQQKAQDAKQPKTNIKTDSWLIRTLNNASIVSAINAKESDAGSTIGESLNSSIREERLLHNTVVTSTPEPVKIFNIENSGSCDSPRKNIMDCFAEKSEIQSPPEFKNRTRSISSTSQKPLKNLSISLIDASNEFVGRATYSETVRRSTGKSCFPGKGESCKTRQTKSISSIEPALRNSGLSGKKYPRRDAEKIFEAMHKSRKSAPKKLSRDVGEKANEEFVVNEKNTKDDPSSENSSRTLAIKVQQKKKDDGGWSETKTKINERGWSIWYSSKRKQALSPLGLEKLAAIHQSILQMDDSKLLKNPSLGSCASGPPNSIIEITSKTTKSSIFLDTISSKLKNRSYHKIEHAIKDFRRVITNSKSCHKCDIDRIAKIEALSKKLEELFVEHFSSRDVENVSGSPINNNGSASTKTPKCKSPQRQQQKMGRTGGVIPKKSSVISTKNDN